MTASTKGKFTFHDLQRITTRLIEHVEVFSGLTQQEVLQLLESAEKFTFDAGESIVREGSTGSFLYVIIEGRVTVLKSGNSGERSTELAQLEAGDSFGEMSLVDHDVRSASVVALSSCVLLRLPENACWFYPATSAKIYRNIARILSRRLRERNEAFVFVRRRY